MSAKHDRADANNLAEIEAHFGFDDVAAAQNVLALMDEAWLCTYGLVKTPPKIRSRVIQLASGDIKELARYAHTAVSDWRLLFDQASDDDEEAVDTGPIWERVEEGGYWDRFYSEFEFSPMNREPDGRSFIEPKGSVVYSLEPIYSGHHSNEWLSNAVNFAVIWGISNSLKDSEPIVVLDWQHPTHLLWHSRASEVNYQKMLGEVAPIAYYDFYAFLSADMTSGSIGDPWRNTLCIFGRPLVDTVEPVLSQLLPVLRDDRSLD